MWRDDAYLLDMLLAARKVQEYTRDVTREVFERDQLLQDAVMRRLSIIGEAARSVSSERKEAHPEIPWKGIIGFRNLVIHEYFRVNVAAVWHVIQHDLPVLVSLLEPIVPTDNNSQKEPS